MTMFSDEALNAAVESSLAPSQRRRLNQLSHAGGQRLLSAAESAELTHLVDLYDRAVLRRQGLWLFSRIEGLLWPTWTAH